jgi:hypothetical protein
VSSDSAQHIVGYRLYLVAYLQLDGLDYLEIGGGDDSKGDNEAKHIYVEDTGNVHPMIIPIPHPLYPTAEAWVVITSAFHDLTSRLVCSGQRCRIPVLEERRLIKSMSR